MHVTYAYYLYVYMYIVHFISEKNVERICACVNFYVCMELKKAIKKINISPLMYTVVF